MLGRSRLEDKGATALAEVFGDLSSLLEVSMPQNGINREGISALATAFAKNTQLRVSFSSLALVGHVLSYVDTTAQEDLFSLTSFQSIDLNDNTFTEEGAVAMAAVLPSLQELRSINFGDCLIRPGGASAIAAAIRDGHKKLEVHISITSSGERHEDILSTDICCHCCPLGAVSGVQFHEPIVSAESG